MIEVTIVRSAADQAIRGFAAHGHAHYDKPGRDIVCAGVSAVTVGTVNAIESLLGVAPQGEMDNGLLRVEEFPEVVDPTMRGNMQLLLESMVVMLRTIEQSYGKYIRITETYQ